LTSSEGNLMQSRLHRFASGTGVLTILVAAMVLLGWQFNSVLLKSVLPGLVPMMPVTAICFLFSGVTFLLHTSLATQRNRAINLLARLLPLAPIAFGAATLVEPLTRRIFWFEQILFPNALLAQGLLHPDAHVLFMSGYADRDLSVANGSRNCQFLQKPLNLRVLATKIRSSLGHVARDAS
jgi:hypothetical protein